MENENVMQLFEEGKVKTGDREFTRLVGGFGEGSISISDKQIADLLNYKNGARQVREQINNNIKHFEFGVHLIDLQRVDEKGTLTETLVSVGYAKQSITQAKNIYMLSQAGFLLYLKFAEGDTSVEIYKSFIEDYFKTKAENIIMKKTLKEEKEFLIEQKKFMLGSMFMEQDELKRMKLFSENEKLSERIKEIDIVLSNEELSKRIQEELQGDLAIAESFTNSDGCWDIGVFCFIKNNEELLIDGWNIFREFAKTKWIWC